MVLFVFIVLFLVIIMDKFYKCGIRLNKKFCIKVFFFFILIIIFVFELYMFFVLICIYILMVSVLLEVWFEESFFRK